MKILVVALFCVFALHLQAQTKLINHKSYSGANATFRPLQVQGNLGLVEVTQEIEPDTESNYKLAYRFLPGTYTYYLFYTTREMDVDVCMKNDRVIESVTVSSNEKKLDIFEKENEETRKRLIEKLHKFREAEKKQSSLRFPG